MAFRSIFGLELKKWFKDFAANNKVFESGLKTINYAFDSKSRLTRI